MFHNIIVYPLKLENVNCRGRKRFEGKTILQYLGPKLQENEGKKYKLMEMS